MAALAEPDTLTPDERRLDSLPMTQVHTREDIFQTRQFRFNQSRSIQHVKNLASSLSTNKRLKPITVWKAGGVFIVLDGHHRLKAYHAVAAKVKSGKALTHIPVKVFEATNKEDAYAFAVSQNIEDKENMNYDDKMEVAWRLVVQGELSLAATAKKAGVGQSSVTTLRKTLQMVRAKYPEVNVRTLPYFRIKAALRQLPNQDALARTEQEQVDRYVDGIAKMKPAACRKARLVARALRQYDAPWMDDVVAEYQKLKENPDECPTPSPNGDEEQDEF
jgi:ParB-like chromosome segregation protein Spo0J